MDKCNDDSSQLDDFESGIRLKRREAIFHRTRGETMIIKVKVGNGATVLDRKADAQTLTGKEVCQLTAQLSIRRTCRLMQQVDIDVQPEWTVG